MTPVDLSRFEIAQEKTYNQAVLELKNGKKLTHWMWYIFPQIQGLGKSAAAIKYAIKDLDEAQAYLNHPILGSRLIECCHTLLDLDNRTALNIFGNTDSLKLLSSLTLFSLTPNTDPIFGKVLAKYFDAKPDDATKLILKKQGIQIDNVANIN